jgi:hypothetical protein
VYVIATSSHFNPIPLSDYGIIGLRKANDEIRLVSSEARTHTKELRKALTDLDVPRIHDQLSEITKTLESPFDSFPFPLPLSFPVPLTAVQGQTN